MYVVTQCQPIYVVTGYYVLWDGLFAVFGAGVFLSLNGLAAVYYERETGFSLLLIKMLEIVGARRG